MIIRSLELAGFRGVRDAFKIEFARGFSVISGRNGVGKSTIFDAIEFALTGNIRKYRVEKAARESIADYIWWRGEGNAGQTYVALTFDDEGEVITIRRDRHTVRDPENYSDILARLFTVDAPQDAIGQLFRTSLIRDDEIASLSLEQSEGDRYRFVSGALGSVDATEFEELVHTALKHAQSGVSSSIAQYDRLRQSVQQSLEELARIRDVLDRADDDKSFESKLIGFVGSFDTTDGLLAAAKKKALDERMRLAQADSRLRNLFAATDELRSANSMAIALRTQQERAAPVAHDKIAQLQVSLEAARANAAADSSVDARSELQVQLLEIGEQLGLIDGKCPLCGSPQAESAFSHNVRQRQESLSPRAPSNSALRGEVERLEFAIAEHRAELSELALNADRQDVILRGAADRYSRAKEELAAFGFRDIVEPEAIADAIATETARLLEVDRAIVALEISSRVGLISQIEQRVAGLRSDAAKVERRLNVHQQAVAQFQEAARAVKRTATEFIDERLAEISPLLSELYQRLRPHPNWHNMEYRMRGEIQGLLSLRVGEGLNPQFMFSSGQRRAAGLAFLLSVFLSLRWSKLKTLLLDDPVQHIDDYRAVNLAEVLGSVRRQGTQVICAVEDSDLAELISRRLRSDVDALGTRIDVDRTPGGDLVASVNVVAPINARALALTSPPLAG